jgi:hypothetical protein
VLLQSDQAQRRLQEAVAHCTAADDPAEAVARLTPLFADTGWLADLADEMIAPLRADPSAGIGQQTSRNGPVLSLTLAAAPPARIMLTLIEGEAERGDDVGTPPPAQSIGFSGAQALYRLLSPMPTQALFAAVNADHRRCRTRAITLRPGRWLTLDERRQSLRILPQAHPILLLRARIERTPPPPVRRYALPDGTFIGAVQADEGFARSAMLLSVLRELGARAAAPEMVGLLDRAAPAERWTVMRELLALDAGTAWPHLQTMAARDPDTGVRAAAQAVLAQQATVREAIPCPA